MEKFIIYISNFFRPIFRPISHWLLSEKRKRPTWHYEGLVVGLILLAVTIITSPYPNTKELWIIQWKQFLIIWLSMFAVFGSFLHAKVGYRMSEAMKASDSPSVSCHEWLRKYWLSKEIFWLLVFLLSGAYPAIVGNIIFIIYPAWRKVHVEERVKIRNIGIENLKKTKQQA